MPILAAASASPVSFSPPSPAQVGVIPRVEMRSSILAAACSAVLLLPPTLASAARPLSPLLASPVREAPGRSASPCSATLAWPAPAGERSSISRRPLSKDTESNSAVIGPRLLPLSGIRGGLDISDLLCRYSPDLGLDGSGCGLSSQANPAVAIEAVTVEGTG